MRWLIHISTVLALLLLAASADAQVNNLIRDGNSDYEDGDYDAAVSSYNEALAKVPTSFPAQFNRADAWYRQGRYADAASQFAQLVGITDEAMHKAMCYHNLGNSFVQQAILTDSMYHETTEALAHIGMDESGDITRKVRNFVARDSLLKAEKQQYESVDTLYVQSIEAYKNSLRIDPTDNDSRYNLVVAKHLLAAHRKQPDAPGGDGEGGDDKDEEQKGATERAKAIKAEADELVKQNKFREALKLMERGAQEDATVAPEYEKFMQKLQVVTKAENQQ